MEFPRCGNRQNAGQEGLPTSCCTIKFDEAFLHRGADFSRKMFGNSGGGRVTIGKRANFTFKLFCCADETLFHSRVVCAIVPFRSSRPTPAMLFTNNG